MKRLWIVCVLVAFSASTAFAKNRETEEKKARKACLSGDWAKGVDILSELFVETKDPAYIFNQGRCLEQSNRYAEAIGKFREYLRVGTAETSASRASAEQHILESEKLLAKESGKGTPVPEGPAALPTTAAQPGSPVPAQAEVEPRMTPTNAPGPDETPQGGRSTLRFWGLISAGVGAAGVVAGVVLNYKANGLADDISSPRPYSRNTESDRAGYETAGWVAYGVGAALVVTGGVLYILGLREKPTTSVAVTPIAQPGMAGAVLGGTF